MTGENTNAAFAAVIETTALRLFEVANYQGIQFRFFGSVAVRLHCLITKHLLDNSGRFPRDIDAAIQRHHRAPLTRLLNDMGWIEDHRLTALTEGQRLSFRHSDSGTKIDISVDHLRYCQLLDLTNRFEVDEPTLPLADLLLSKLQIVELSASDCMDIALLFLEHCLGENDKDRINTLRIANVLYSSWRWYHAVEKSLVTVNAFVEDWSIPLDDKEIVRKRIFSLQSFIQKMPKSVRWKIRNIFGESIVWYVAVSDI